MQILDLKDCFLGLRVFLLNLENYVTSDHQSGDLGFIEVFRIVGTHAFAAAKNGNLGTDAHDLFQFVRDKDDRYTGITELEELLEQFFGFLRCKNGCRFVEDQDLRAFDQRLQNFNLLHLAYGQCRNLGGSVNFEIVFIRNFLCLLDCGVVVKQTVLHRLNAERNVFRNAE